MIACPPAIWTAPGATGVEIRAAGASTDKAGPSSRSPIRLAWGPTRNRAPAQASRPSACAGVGTVDDPQRRTVGCLPERLGGPPGRDGAGLGVQDRARLEPLLARPAPEEQGGPPSALDRQVGPRPRGRAGQHEPLSRRPAQDSAARRAGAADCPAATIDAAIGAPARASASGIRASYTPPNSVSSSTAQSGGFPSKAFASAAEPRSKAPPIGTPHSR